jgi:hypothetical protein
MTPPEGAEASPRNEVDAVRWLTRERVLEELTYERDAKIVESLEGLGAY